jgi:hypothetical protein
LALGVGLDDVADYPLYQRQRAVGFGQRKATDGFGSGRPLRHK